MGNKFYNFAWTVLRPAFDILYPRKVTGTEYLPAEGGFVLCLNHCSAVDPLFVSTRIPRKRRMYFMAKKELFDNKFLRPFVTWLGGIPVDRGNADLSAIRTSMKVLKDGYGLGIFPQGTRSKDNTPTPMLPGAAMIALRGGVPVIPAYIDGPYRLFHHVDIRFGAPLDLSDFGRRCDHDTLVAATARISDAIWALRSSSKT